MPHTVLVVDDDADLRNAIRAVLENESYEVEEAANGDELLTRLGEGRPAPGLILMDLVMPGTGGMAVLETIGKTRETPLPVIVMTGHSSARVAIEAMRLGAYDYLTKPFDIDDALLTVGRFFEWLELQDNVASLTLELGKRDPEDRLIGNAASMQEIYKTIGRVARSEATVLITGETGTGKELVASILHQTSPFARGPMIKVNCAALPESLLESELFGHEKGAFTGAVAQRKGRFEMANKGSIFLDEVGEMTLATQKKLLRVLQEREFERVGGSSTVKVDTRVIAATNKDLVDEVSEGRFREDLYYRLNVIQLDLPPLRERQDDIPLLVEHFLDKHRYTNKSDPARISQPALDLLLAHGWPGNVRELENTIERAVIFAGGGVIGAEHINFNRTGRSAVIDIARRIEEGATLSEILAETERKSIHEALLIEDDEERAANLLGIDIDRLRETAVGSST